MNRKLLRSTLTLVVLVFLYGCANLVVLPHNQTTALVNPGDTPMDAARVRRALLTAANERGWTVVTDKPGRLRLKLALRSHVLHVEIPYADDSYTVEYVSSQNLNYTVVNGVEKIHKSYVRWLKNLEQSAQRALLVE